MTSDFYKMAKEAEPALVKYLRDIVAIPSMSSDEERVVHRIGREMEKLDFDEVNVDPMGTLAAVEGESALRGKHTTLTLRLISRVML